MLLVPSKKLDLDVKTWQLPERLCRLIASHSSKDNPASSPPQLFQVDNDTDIQTFKHSYTQYNILMFTNMEKGKRMFWKS